MASKKINWNLANSIAHAIAEKAFEHLVKPLEKALEDIGTEAAEIVLEQINPDVLIRLNIVKENSAPKPIMIRCADDESKDSALAVPATLGFTLMGWENIETIVPDEMWNRANDIARQLTSLCSKRQEMSYEMQQQLTGTTTAAAIKAWPEAESIISDVAGLIGSGNFTVPLDNLLAKYMPLLPAPQGA